MATGDVLVICPRAGAPCHHAGCVHSCFLSPGIVAMGPSGATTTIWPMAPQRYVPESRAIVAERDAARYRHLREYYLSVEPASKHVYTGDYYIPGDDPDAAIDADIERRKG